MWRYAIIEISQKGADPAYGVCEEYDVNGSWEDTGWTGAVQVIADTPEELLTVLDMMKNDIIKSLEEGRRLVDTEIAIDADKPG